MKLSVAFEPFIGPGIAMPKKSRKLTIELSPEQVEQLEDLLRRMKETDRRIDETLERLEEHLRKVDLINTHRRLHGIFSVR